jgi:hypothetical protein
MKGTGIGFMYGQLLSLLYIHNPFHTCTYIYEANVNIQQFITFFKPRLEYLWRCNRTFTETAVYKRMF